jgi:hypothetical protein
MERYRTYKTPVGFWNVADNIDGCVMAQFDTFDGASICAALLNAGVTRDHAVARAAMEESNRSE